MAIDPSIALAYRNPEFNYSLIQSPVQQMGQVLTLQNLMQQHQMGQLEYQKALLQWQELQNLSNLFAQPGAGHIQPGAAPGAVAAPAAPGPVVAPAAPPAVTPVTPATPIAPAALLANLAPGQSLSDMMGGAATPLANLAPATGTDTTQGAAPAPAPTPTAQPQAGTPTGSITAPADFPMPDFAAWQKAAPTTWMQYANTYMTGAKNFYDAQTARLTYQKDVGADVAKLAQRLVADPTEGTKMTIIAEARQKGYIGDQEAHQLMGVSPTADVWKQWLQQGMSSSESAANQIAQADQHLKNLKEQRDEFLFGPQYTKAVAEGQTATTGALAARRAQEAQTLNAAWQQDAAARQQGQQGHAVETVYNGLPDDSKQFFAGVTAPGGFLTRALTAPEAVAAAETQRQHDIENRAAYAKYLQDKEKFDLEFGRGSVDSMIEQVYHNPDTAVQNVKPEFRTAVQNGLQAKYGVTFPNPLVGEPKQQETAARSTVDAANYVMSALDDPAISKNIGAVLGKFQDLQEKTGAAYFQDPATVAKAQELRTRLRLLLNQEPKEFGGRLSPAIVNELQKSGPRVDMDINMLKGALKGTRDASMNELDNLDKQRFGGNQMRPRSVRGLEPNEAQRSFILGQNKGPGTYPLSDGTTWYLTSDGTIIPR